MAGKPSYEELERSIRALEEEVSARRQPEKVLQIQKAYLEQLLESAPEGIALADTDHRLSRVNAQFGSLFGYAPEEAVGGKSGFSANRGREQRSRLIGRGFKRNWIV